MKYMFLPLDQHSDFGFGVMGDSFERAANKLSEDEVSQIGLHPQFPINFLYRHAVELYLKSCITNIQRHLNGGKVLIEDLKIGAKERPLANTHSIKELFDHFKMLVSTRKDEIESASKTKWSEIPEELPGLIEVIEFHDSKSTYFRYPGTNNSPTEAKKSSMREIDVSEYLESAKTKTGSFSFMEIDENDEVQRVFLMDNTRLDECRISLKAAANHLSGASIGLRMELANGK